MRHCKPVDTQMETNIDQANSVCNKELPYQQYVGIYNFFADIVSEVSTEQQM